MHEANQEQKLAKILSQVWEPQQQLFKKQNEIVQLHKNLQSIKFPSAVISFADLQAAQKAEQEVKEKQSEIDSLQTKVDSLINQAIAHLPIAASKHLENRGNSYLTVKWADNDFYALLFLKQKYVVVWNNNLSGLADAVAKFRTEHMPPTLDFSMAGPFYR